MADEVSELALPRRGHFELGTGYHGDLWLDLDTLFLWPARLRPHIRRLAGRLAEHRVTAVCGPASGGAYLAQALAAMLGAAFLPASQIPGPHPGGPPAYRIAPSLLAAAAGEGGWGGGWRVAVADDAVNAGTAVLACCQELRAAGGVPVAVAALLALGRADAVITAQSVPFYAAARLDSQVWPSGRCPLCARGVPLTDPVPRDDRPG